MASEIKKETSHIQGIFETISYQSGCSFTFMICTTISNNTGVVLMDRETSYQRYSNRRIRSLSYFKETLLGNVYGNPLLL
jgi:hypothetical protein